MGNRGPKPKPTALKVFSGVRTKSGQTNEPQPKSSKSVPSPPSYLRKHGRAQWRHLAPLLWATNCLTEQDLGLLGQYCDAWDDWHEANDDIVKFGMKAVGSVGNDILNPMVRAKKLAGETIKSLSGHFGLSPSSRVGMNAPTQDEGHDDLESFKAS